MGGLNSVWPTNLYPVRADVKHSNHSGDERTNGPKVETPDTPGAINQKHHVGLCFGLTRHIWQGKNTTSLLSQDKGNVVTPEKRQQCQWQNGQNGTWQMIP